MKRILPFIIILLVLGVAVGSVYYLKRSSSSPSSSTVATNNNSGSTTAPVTKPTPDWAQIDATYPGATPAHTYGPANAPAHIEEFGDFQCPPCGLFHPILKQMKKEFGDNLRVTFRQFPLSQMHKNAIAAASASEAAAMQGKFWEMHALIFEHQDAWKDEEDPRPIFEAYAREIKLDIDRYKKDMNSEEVAQRIFADRERGEKVRVGGTPTVFLNGMEVPFESLPADKLRPLIQAQIKK